MNKRELLSPIPYIALAGILIIALKYTIIDFSTIQGVSMEPTLKPGHIVVYSRIAYGVKIPIIHRYLVKWKMPESGDIIVLKDPRNKLTIVKRCQKRVGEELFVIGDNRSDSIDSRDFGLVPINLVEGKVIFYK